MKSEPEARLSRKQWDITGRPLLERMMANSVGEKTRLPDDFAERYLLLTNLLIDSTNSNFMATEMEESDVVRASTFA